MDKRKVAGSVGFLVYGGATIALAAGEIDNPRQVNDLGKGLVYIATTSGTTETSIVHVVPNVIAGAEFDATPWARAEDALSKPAYRISRRM